MKKYIATFLLFLNFMACSFAQNDANKLVHDGEADYLEKDYQSAYDKMNEAMKSFDKLSKVNQRKVYYYRAESLLDLYATAAINKDTTILFQHRNAILEAYHDFKNCVKYDSMGTWTVKVQEEYQTLYPVLLQTGYTMAQNEYNEKALEYLDACIEIVGDYYITYDMRSQAKLALKDSSGSIDDLQKAKDYFIKKPPNEISFEPYSLFYRLAWLQHFYKHDDKSALKTLSDGISGIGRMKTKFDGNNRSFTEDEKKEMLALYQKLVGDMKTLQTALKPADK